MKYVIRSLSYALSSVLLYTITAQANPTGGTVPPGGGTAVIPPTSPLLTIDVSTAKTIINWQSFSIASGETTHFNFLTAAGASPAVLNRVGGPDASTIAGILKSSILGDANNIGGSVFLLNPHGILFSATAQINVGSLVASTLSLADNDFLTQPNLTLSGTATTGIQNQGTISALGDVYLIAHTVKNEGTITAGNHAGLAAATTVTLLESGNERLTVEAGTGGTGAAVGVENSAAGKINAVVAELKAAGGNIYALAINNGGEVRATSLVSQNGRITLRAGDPASGGNKGKIANSGLLQVSGSPNDGVLVQGSSFALKGTAAGNAGINAGSGPVNIQAPLINLLGNAEITGGSVFFGGAIDAATPVLAYQAKPSGLEVSWDVAYQGFVLKKSPSPAGPWTEVTLTGPNTALVPYTEGPFLRLEGAVGQAGADWKLAVNGSSTFLSPVGSMLRIGTLELNGPATLNGGLVQTLGAQSYNDLTLGAATVLRGTTVGVKGNLAGAGNDLAIDGAAVLGDAQVDTVSGLKNLTVSGTTSLNAGSVSSTEKQTYTGDLTAAGGAKTLTGTTVETKGNLAGGGNDVTIAGGAVLGDAEADAVTGVKNLSVSGSALLNAGAVSTSEKQTYGDLNAVGGNKTLTATTVETKGSLTGGGNDVTIVGGAILGGAQADTVSGVKNLTVLSTTVLKAGSVTTTEKQTYADDLTAAGGDKTLTAASVEAQGSVIGGGNDLTIVGAAVLGDAQADTVTGVKNLSVSGTTVLNAGTVTTTEKQTYTGDLMAAGGAKTLSGTTVEAQGNLAGGGNDVTIAGGAVLGDAQADTVSGVRNLTVSGATLLNAGAVTTAEKQTYGGDLTAAGGNKALSATTVETKGNVIGGGNDVAIAGAAVLGDAQADTVTGVKNLTVSGTTLLNAGSVTTTEKQIYTADFTAVGGNKTLSAATLETKGNVIGGGNDLAIAGAAVLGDAQGDAVTGVKNLSVSGTTLLNAGTVATSQNQQYGGVVTLGAPVVLGSSGGGNITLANGASGPWSLDVNTAGATSFGAPVTVAQLTTDADGTSSSVGVQTTGATEFKDDTTVAGLYSATTFTADKSVTLGSDATISAASVLLAGPVSGGFGLVVNGALDARDLVGSGTKLNSLTVHGPFAFDGGSLSTVGDQTYDGAVTLGGAGAQVLDAGAGKLSANNTVAKTTPGNLVLGGAAGVEVAGALNVSGGNLRVAGDLTAGNNVTASQDLELQNASVAGAVTATAGRITTANLSASSVSAGGPVLIGGSAIVSGNVQGSTVAITGPATLGADVTATAGAVGFGDTVTLNGSGDQTITAGVGGIATGTGKAMTKTTLGNLFLVGLVNLNGDLAVNQGNLKVVGDVTSMGNISASGDILLDNASALGRDITAGGSLNALSLTAGNLSAGSSLGVLNDATVSGNMTAGSTLTVNGTVRLGGNATAGNGASFGGPLFLTGSQAQTVDAGAGQLAANDRITKTDGDLTLGGNGGVLVKGLLSTDSGNLNVTDDLTAQADVSAGKALTVQGASQFAGNVNAGNGATLNGAVTLNGPADQTMNGLLGQLVANNTVTKNTPGNLTLSSGPGVLVKANLVVNGGTLIVQNDLAAGADVTAKGATFQGALSLNGNADQTVDTGPGLLLVQQAVGKTGNGNLLLQGANGVTVQGNLSVAPGALTISGGPTTLQGNMASANGATFNSALTLNGADQSLNAGTGLLKADSTVTKPTAGNLTLAGGQGVQLANNVTVNDGNLTVQNALTTLGSLTASKDMNLAGAAQVAGNVAAGSALVVGGPMTLGGDVTANGALFQSSLALTRTGDQVVNAGTGLLQANSTLTKNIFGNLLLQGQQGVNVVGNISVAPGALTVSGGNATLGGSVAAVGATFNGPVILNGADQVVDAGTGKLVGNGTLTKTTAGNLILGGDQGVQAAGDIAVNAGNLVVQDSLTAQGGVQASGGVTLQDATVGGNLAAGNALSVNGGATLGGNASAGSGATFSGPLALNGATDQSVQAGSGQLLAKGPVTKTGGNLALGGGGGVRLENTADVTGGSLTVMNDLTSLSAISASQDVNLRNTIAGGSVTAGHDINVNGNAVLGGNLVGGHNTTLSGGATLSGTGDQLLEASAGRLSVGSDVTKAAGNLDLAGSTGVALGGNVEATAGTINIMGPANLNGNLVAGQGATVNGPLTLSGGDQSLNANAGKLTLSSSVIDSSGGLTLAGHNGVDLGSNLKVSGGDLHFGDKVFFRAPDGFSVQAPAATANGAMTFGGDIELFADTRVEATGFAFTGPIIDNGFAFILNGINPLSFADDEMKRRLSSIAPKETRAEGKPPQYLSETRPPFPYPGSNKGSSEIE